MKRVVIHIERILVTAPARVDATRFSQGLSSELARNLGIPGALGRLVSSHTTDEIHAGSVPPGTGCDGVGFGSRVGAAVGRRLLR